MRNEIQIGIQIDVTESLLVHPSHSDGLVDSGDPVVVGRLAGVSNVSALATTDKVAIQTFGVFALAVTPVHNGIGFGETVFIDPSSAVLSDDLADVPFGVSVDETSVASGATGTINIKLFGCTPGASGANS